MTITHVDRRELRRLAASRGLPRISLYLPTFRSGERVREGPIRLKNLLVKARELAEGQGIDARAVAAATRPVSALVDDVDLWNHQGDGLALFASSEELDMRRLPVPVEELAVVGDRFCVRPLLAAAADPERFLVLALSQKHVRLVECTRDGARELDLGSLPESLSEALGEDWEPKSLQFHTGTATGAGRRSAVFHGQGGGRDEAKEEIRRFMQIVDDGLSERVDDRSTPLVVAAVDYLIPMFRDATQYPSLVDGGIVGSPDALDAGALRERALPLVEPWLSSERRRAIDRFAAAAHSDRGACGVEAVLRAGVQSRIETLLVRAGTTVWGRFDEETGACETHDERRAADDDLVDRAVSLALGSGATVHAVTSEEAPSCPDAGAVLRY